MTNDNDHISRLFIYRRCKEIKVLQQTEPSGRFIIILGKRNFSPRRLMKSNYSSRIII